MHRIARPGFTLVELLVVIAIIVVLLALLVPSLDKAIFQAELAVCGTRLKAIGNGAFVYASDHKRSYPYRSGVHAETIGYKPNLIQLREHNDRIAIAPYIPINKALNDPIAGEVDFENSDADTNIEASYALWFGWKYNVAGGGAGMDKIGSKFAWQGDRFSVIASDYELNGLDQENFTYGSHSDASGHLQNVEWQDLPIGATAGLIGGTKYTLARWHGGAYRGPVEMNFAHADGSVRRVNAVTVTQGAANPRDPRLKHVPGQANNNEPAYLTPLPPG